MDFKGKVAFITGAARGIGKGAAVILAKYGADIVLADKDKEGIEKAAQEIRGLGRKALAMSIDVSNSADVDRCVNEAVGTFGKIDILVNCAGIVVSSRLSDLPEETWDRVMDINTKGVFLVCKAVSKHMMENKYGKIINIASQAAKVGEAANGAYCASKAAVVMLTQVLGLELAEYNINVNALCPGFIDTEMVREVFEKRGPLQGMTPDEFKNSLLTSVPLKRMGTVEDTGELIAFLASDKAGYITGVPVTIAGGHLLF